MFLWADGQTRAHRILRSGVEVIRLRAALAAVDLDGSRVNDLVLGALMFKITVQPTTVAASFVARDHWCLRGQAKPLLGFVDLNRE
jgi:hypothetical protein